MKNRFASFLSLCLFFILIVGVVFQPQQSVKAAVPAGFSEFYIPGTTDQLFYILRNNDNDPQIGNANVLGLGAVGTCATGTGSCNLMHSVLTVVIAVDNTTVYYDHWENGLTSGATGDETYTGNKGTVLVFETSNIPVPRNAANNCASTFPAGGTGGAATKCYDGGDRIYTAGGAVSVAQAFWPEVNGTVYANAWEIYPVKPYQSTYILPVGEDLFGAPRNYADFKHVYVIAQATADNTTITIDDPLVPGVQVNVTLNKGQTTQYIHANTGTTVVGSQPIQVQFIAGQDWAGTASDTRSYTAVPQSLWDTAYYSPVPSANAATEADIYIYNPTASNLLINYQDRLGSGTITIPPNSTRSYSELVGRAVPTTSAVALNSANGTTKFWAIGSYDTENADYNYGFSLIPASTLTQDYYVGWAPGTTDLSNNGSPVFVTATQDNTTVFVDYSPNDGVVDATYTLNRIGVQTIRDLTDNNNTGMHIWSTAPIALVWGEDDTYAAIGNPYIDAGYAILPLRPEWIDIVVTLDKTSNPTSIAAAAGQVSLFTVKFDAGAYGLDNVFIQDVLPANWAYIPGTTNITWPGGSSTANPTGGTGPNLSWGSAVSPLASLLPNQTLTLTYQAQTTGVPPNYSINTAIGAGTYNGTTFTASDTTTVVATPSDLSVVKTNNVVGSALVGNPFNWNLQVLNSSSGGLASFATGQVVLRDNLPAGPTYGAVTVTNGAIPPAGTGSLACSIALNVLTCTASGGTVTLPTGASFTVTFPVTPAAAGTLTNPAAGGGNVCQVDPNAVIAESNEGNNTCTNSVTVVAPSLSMAKTANPVNGTSVGPGNTITYTVTVNNTGGTTQNNVVINDALPAGTTFVSGQLTYPATYADNFGTQAYNNNNGTRNFGAVWVETDPNGAAQSTTAGNVQVAADGAIQYVLRPGDNAAAAPLNGSVSRIAGNLSACTTVSLNFDYRRSLALEAGDFLYVDASADGGGAWTNNVSNITAGTDAAYVASAAIDLTAYKANLGVRFRSVYADNGGAADTDRVFIDNVRVTCSSLTLASHAPTNMITGVDDIDLPAGTSMTLVYSVTVNTPVPGGLTSIVNTALVSSDEQPQPLTSTTTHPIPASTDLTVSKANNVSGFVVLGSPFNWTINANNGSASTATFTTGQTIMSDPLPGVAGYYPQGALTVTNGATPPTGTISCSITGTALSCVASGGSVTLPAGASFSVTFAVTPTVAGSLANTATVDPNNNVTESNEANNTGSDTVTVVVPPTIVKSFGANPIAVNGTSVITFTITNPVANTVALTGVAFTDTYPAGLQNAAAPAASTTCAGGVVIAAANGPSVSLSGATIPVGGSCTVTVTVTGTTAGTKTNTVTVTSTNGGTGNTSTAKLGVISAAKSVVATSEDSTTGQNVAIGEVVRYRLVIDLPEGTTTNLQLLDNLVANMAYLNDNSTRVALICNSGAACASSSTAAIGTNPVISGNSVVAPTFVLPAASITGGAGNPYADGVDPTFSLGNVTNNDNDADAEYVVIEFNSIVRNVLLNQDGNNRGNTFTVNVNGAALVTTTSGVNDQVTIREPVIGPITKSITTTPTDAGDTITYQLQFTNTGTGPAFDIVLTDALNAVLTTPVTVTGSTTGGACGSTASTVSGSYTAPNATATVTCLAAGGTATINISATVNNTALAGYTFSNSANLVYTSLPGATGTPNGSGGNATGSSNPGAAGTGNGERNGSGGTNDYTSTSNTVNTTLANPSLAKTINPAGTQYAVGATIPYQITITVPEGVTGNPTANLVDTIPTGLVYVAGSLTVTPQAGVTIGAAGPYTDANAAFFNLTGQTMTLTFGSFTSTASGVATNRTITVTFLARVNNVVGNQSGTAFTNSVDLVRTNPNGAGTLTLTATAPTVSVIEPDLNVAKAASTITPLLNSTLTYTLTINHTGASNSIAYDTRITDAMPAGLTGLTNVNVTSVGGCATGVTNNSTGTSLDVTIGTIPLGCVVTVTYDVTVSGAVASTQTNNVNMTWTSLSGASPNERTGTDGVGGALNDYADTTSVNVTVTDPATSVISDFIWNDLDGDGVQDAGEPGLNGVRVYVDSNNNNAYDVGEPTALTNASGVYAITGLPGGTYNVRVDTTTLPAGFVQTYDLNGGLDHEASVVLAPAQTRTDVDFGYQQQNAVISDFIWNDLDGDGVQDVGEPGLNGIRVYIDSNGNNTYDIGEPTAVTAGGGLYSIGNLASGTYDVRVDTTTLPAGYNPTYDLNGGNDNEASVTVTAGQVRTDVDFGYQQQNAVISDFIWNDLDGDGVQDVGEPGLNGVRVYIDSNGNNTYDIGEPTAVTNATGNYAITGLPAGTYDVRVDTTTLPAGYNPTYDLNGGNDNEASVTVTAGQVRTDVDFGYQQQNAVISDFIWNDLDGDGAQDVGEPGLNGVRVYIDSNGNNTYDVGEPTATTNATGNYAITGLAAGTYDVRVDTATLPAGYNPTYDLNGGNDNEASVTVTAGQVRTDVDFGYQQQNAVISDFIWNDLDGDGAQDVGEPGLNGVRVYVDLNGNNTYDVGEPTAVTNATGNYAITGLAAGTYDVRVDTTTLPAGYNPTYDLNGGNDNEASVTVTAGQVRTDVDFGYQQQNAVISDFIWNDLDGDGAQDAGEPGLNGVRVYIDSNGNNTYDIGEPTAVTNATGNYSIAGLAAGTYDVRVDTTTLPAGYVQTFDLNGALDNEASVTVTAGQTRTDVDFGYQQQNAVISDYVWNDVNGDGLQAGETGLDGVRVYIDSNNNNTYDAGEPTAVTAGGGLYSIGNLAAGTYAVRIDTTTLPAGYGPTYDLDGIGTSHEANVTVTAGQIRTDVDFGYQQQNAVISNFVWDDANGDGVQDPGEPGLIGVRVYIDSNNNNTYDVGEPNDLTDGAGLYAITGLAAGTYNVRVDLNTIPAGNAPTYDLDGGNDNEASVTVTAGQTRTDVDFGYIGPRADLELDKSVSNATPQVATNINFTLTITNAGPDTATNVTMTDVLPSGFTYVTSTATQGAYNNGTGVWTVGTLLLNQSKTLTITVTVNLTGSYTNYAQISASDLVDPDSLPNNNSTTEDDDDAVTVMPLQNNPNGLTKTINASNQAFTTNPNVAVGEIVTYQVAINVPPGVFNNAQFVDTMDRGLSFMNCTGIVDNGLTTSVAGSFASICSTPTVDDAGGGTTVDVGRRVTFNFGTLTNSTGADQALVLTYRAVVLDSAGNVSGTNLRNTAVFQWTGGNLGPSVATVTVVEPDVAITKTASTTLVSVGSEVTITLNIQHTSSSETSAFETLVTDVLPAEMDLVPGTLECVSGAQDADSCVYDAGTRTVSATWNTFTLTGGNGRVTFRVRILTVPNTGISNTANVFWTSLPGIVSTPQNANIFSTERDYDPASQIDVYGTSSTLQFNVFGSIAQSGQQLPATGFAPNRVTDLSNTPREIYSAVNGVTVEIPSLGINIPIVGVPLKDGGWNVAWLGKQAGWLEGSAFPSYNGNSVLTSHVYLSNGLPGPFVNLNKLKFGDKIIFHAYGQKYVFEVRTNAVVEPNDVSILKHEEKPWLTLVTCKEYDEKTNSYKKRVVVRAILVSVEWDR